MGTPTTFAATFPLDVGTHIDPSRVTAITWNQRGYPEVRLRSDEKLYAAGHYAVRPDQPDAIALIARLLEDLAAHGRSPYALHATTETCPRCAEAYQPRPCEAEFQSSGDRHTHSCKFTSEHAGQHSCAAERCGRQWGGS